MRTVRDAREAKLSQAEREKKMTWQEIRDDSISKLRDITTAVSSGFIEKEIQAERYSICENCSEFKKTTRRNLFIKSH